MRHHHGMWKGNRKDLAGEHKLGDTGQLILACVFIIVWMTDTFILKYTTSLNAIIPLAARIPLGTVLFALSGMLARKGLSIVFGEERQKPVVIRTGVYSIVRHPIYLGEHLLYLSFLTWSVSLAAALVWLIAVGFLHYISLYEEGLLIRLHGEAYEAYRRDVPMWIPRIPRKPKSGMK